MSSCFSPDFLYGESELIIFSIIYKSKHKKTQRLGCVF